MRLPSLIGYAKRCPSRSLATFPASAQGWQQRHLIGFSLPLSPSMNRPLALVHLDDAALDLRKVTRAIIEKEMLERRHMHSISGSSVFFYWEGVKGALRKV